MGLAYEHFVDPDWSKGLAGTGGVDYGSGYLTFDAYGPTIAESWKIPEVGTWVFQIRKGVRYALDPASEASRLVNGRELTADDVVWNVWRLHKDPKFPQSGARFGIPRAAEALSVEKTGPWEVTLKTPVDPWTAFFWVVYGGCSQYMYAREVIDKYGNANDWRRVVGTGPFMVTDYITDSAATLKRNPNYWKKNPVGPGKGDQVPYVDTVKLLAVPDLSTRLAVMRTGRADQLSSIEGEDARTLLKSTPRLQFKKSLPGGRFLELRLDKPNVPYADKRVRQALLMATDYEAMKNDLYGGDAEIYVWPVAPTYKNLYLPVEQWPDSARALYKYNPEKAKQLLTEAGYPNGFKIKIMVLNSSEQVDPVSVFKAMWAKVGVEVEIQPRERTTYVAIATAFSFDDAYLSNWLIGGSITGNYSFWGLVWSPYGFVFYDPTVEKAHNEMQKLMFVNMPKADDIFRQMLPHVLEQAYMIPKPTPYSYTVWQPWVKNYYGETTTGMFLPYVWVDQDLKEQITGRR